MNLEQIEDIYSLSPLQQGMLFQTLFDDDPWVYFQQLSLRLRGRLDPDAFERAWQRVVEQTPALRTSFEWYDLEVPLQLIRRSVELSCHYEDWTALAREEQEARLAAAAEADRRTPFDLTTAPLMRLRVARLGEDEDEFVWSYHHILLDGWSLPLVLGDVFSCYEALARGREWQPPRRRPFGDYVGWLQERDETAAREFWRDALKGFTSPTRLPLELARDGRAAGASEQFASEHLSLSPEATAGLHGLTRHCQVTLNTVVQGAWALLLGVYGGEGEVVYGTTVSGRPPELAGVETMIGLFINTLPARARLDPRESLATWLRGLQRQLAEMRQFEYSSLVEIQKWSDAPAGRPLFESLLVFENYPVPDAGGGEERLLRVGGMSFFEQGNYPLTLSVGPGVALTLRCTYDSRRFDAAGVRQLLGHLSAALSSMSADPRGRLADIELLSAAERERLLSEWGAGPAPAAPAPSVHALFARRAHEHPDAVALVCGDQQLTYAALDLLSNSVAARLLAAGLEPDTAVGLSTGRTPASVAALLGILKAGGAYLALDPSYPPARLALLVRESGARLVLADEASAPALSDADAQVVSLEWALSDTPTPGTHEATVTLRATTRPVVQTHAGARLAYVSFTSGSTGTPKGVAVTHAAVINLACQETFARLGPAERVLHAAPLSFDASTFELWGALLTGGCVVLHEGRVPEAATLRRAVEEGGVSVLWLTSSLFNAVADEDVQCLRGVAELLVGGEALSAQHVWRAFAELDGVTMVNGYGPTETTTFACTHRITSGDAAGASIPIGRPVAGAVALVLDGRMRAAPEGAVGELYVGGAGLARGYVGRPEMTAERFVPDPFSKEPGARLYRTGDLVRWSAGGVLEYLGRADGQVKVRGHRIELGEVEVALREHPEVEEATVVVRDGAGGEKRLVAYYVAAEGGAPGSEAARELRAYLRGRVPEYMVPSQFVELEALPLNANGKVDRKALPDPSVTRQDEGQTYEEPRTPTERTLSEVWAQALGLERVGVEDNYFELGGDSIISIRLTTRARERGLDFRLQDLFTYPTVKELAEVLAERSRPAQAGRLEPFDLLAESDRARLPHGIEDAYPLTRLQSGMIFHSQYEPDAGAVYHCVFDFHLRMRWEEEPFRAAVGELLRRHAVLRTSFDLTAFSEPLQLVHADLPTPLEVIDLRGVTEDEQREALARAAAEEKGRRFDWKAAPLIRFRVFRRGTETIHLVITFPHAVLDGWSVSLLLTELFQHYWHLVGEATPDAAAPPPSKLTYGHFVALEQRALAADETSGFWERKLRDAESLRLPRWDDARRDARGMKRTVAMIPTAVSDGLAALAKAEGVPLKSTLLAAHLRVLGALCGREDVLTGLVSHGRPEGEDGERVLGLFLNTVPLRLGLRGGTWAELVRATFEAERELLPHRLYPITEIQRTLGGGPLFEVAFNYTHFHSYGELSKFGDRMELIGDGGAGETHFTLTVDFNVSYTGAETRLHLAYDSAQLSDAQAAAFGDYYARTLAAMASSPSSRYESFTPLSEAELQQLLREWNDGSVVGDVGCGVAELFARRAAQSPDAAALIFGDEVVTAAEVERRAARLGRHLRAQGVGAGARVGVCAERAPELVVGLLAVIKAGAAYVPIDPTYPEERLEFMLEDAGASVLLTQRRLAGRLPTGGARVVFLDEEVARDATAEEQTLPVPVGGSERPLYVIYTSGSTGKPKGVTGLHGGALTRFRWMWERYPFEAGEVCCQKTSLGFVDAVWEIFGGLLGGVPTVIIDEETSKDPGRLLDALARHGVTRLVLVPSLLKVLLAEQARRPRAELAVRLWVSSGEALPEELVRQLGELLPGARLLNLYGSSEVSADVSAADMTARGSAAGVSIGRPIAGSEVFVLGEGLVPVPSGAEGEIYVGGRGLAAGYHGRPDLTAERFVPHPHSERPGARLYRTGDLGTHAHDGELLYRGRLDHQVKIRGHRIELGEVEAALRRHEGVQAAVADMREDAAGESRLVAYYVATASPLSEDELLRRLKERLPAHMLPSAFVRLEELPLTASGKVDRRRLPAPSTVVAREATYVEPRNALEQMLAETWAEALGVEKVSIEDNFFDLGGHSLLATQVITRVWETFHLDLPLKVMFEKPTVAEFAEVVAQQLIEEETAADEGVLREA